MLCTSIEHTASEFPFLLVKTWKTPRRTHQNGAVSTTSPLSKAEVGESELWEGNSQHLSKCVSVTQSCPTICEPMGCSPPGPRLLCPWDSPDKNTEVSCHSLLQGVFLTQRQNPGLLHCRQILDHLSHRQSPI